MGPNLTMGLEEELVCFEPSSKAMLHDPGVIKRVKTGSSGFRRCSAVCTCRLVNKTARAQREYMNVYCT